MGAFYVGQEVSWSGMDAYVVAVGGITWGSLLAEPWDEDDASPAPIKGGRVAVAIRLRDKEPPRDGFLDEETEEMVRHADVGDWLPLWVNASALRVRRSSRAAS